MVRYDFNPLERHEVLRCKSEEKRLAFCGDGQFNTYRPANAIEIEGQFPIKELFLLHTPSILPFAFCRAVPFRHDVVFL